jgi:HEPN domain-containing protein
MLICFIFVNYNLLSESFDKMINIEKQIDYWKKGAVEEYHIAAELFEKGHNRHGLFFLHLTIEKLLKAHVCKKTGDVPPRTHNLLRLSEMTDFPFEEDKRNFLSKMLRFNIEGRYPDSYEDLPSEESVHQIQIESEQLYLWLLNQL